MEKLRAFIREQCQQRRLSARRLSVEAGLSPSMVYVILHKDHQPTMYTLNHLADYLGVERVYLWQLAGLLDDMDFDPEASFNDPRLKYHFAQVDNWPIEGRNLVISFIETLSAFFSK